MLPDALFDSGSALVSSTGQTRLAKIANVILAQPGLKVEVDGYTGPAAVFQSGLSVGRASSVRLYLISQGIDERNVVQKSVTVPPSEAATGLQLSRDVALVISAQINAR
jgi:outer membrane protein OmpA-like peptidoglycan-associated protein